MAGSYRHCENEDRTFTFDHIENMGDAYEACHMMYFMIHHLSGGDEAKIEEASNAYFASPRAI